MKTDQNAAVDKEAVERAARLKAQDEAKATDAANAAAAEAERQAKAEIEAKRRELQERAATARAEIASLEQRLVEIDEKLPIRRKQFEEAVIYKPTAAWHAPYTFELLVMERAQAWDIPVLLENREKELADVEKQLAAIG